MSNNELSLFGYKYTNKYRMTDGFYTYKKHVNDGFSLVVPIFLCTFAIEI